MKARKIDSAFVNPVMSRPKFKLDVQPENREPSYTESIDGLVWLVASRRFTLDLVMTSRNGT